MGICHRLKHKRVLPVLFSEVLVVRFSLSGSRTSSAVVSVALEAQHNRTAQSVDQAAPGRKIVSTCSSDVHSLTPQMADPRREIPCEWVAVKVGEGWNGFYYANRKDIIFESTRACSCAVSESDAPFFRTTFHNSILFALPSCILYTRTAQKSGGKVSFRTRNEASKVLEKHPGLFPGGVTLDHLEEALQQARSSSAAHCEPTLMHF